ncbi:homocitrate synthase [Limisalsivibrio acetivorans]|uniref:homocitrate synthase n=1 Tax=Limisalsivibrio acetivorans TaxID=1304888 RepID=UPI0003B51461|nr:homocitrate synthase [Limisalsivibrio acetivorans]
MKGIIIDDTTLRDGEQTPGVCFTREEKLEIARRLDSIGVQEIEAGIPVMGRDEAEEFSAILDLGLDARIIAWNRAMVDDVRASINAGADSVEISLPVSDIQIKSKLGRSREWVLKRLKTVLDFCTSKGLYTSVGGEDASRGDMEFLIEYAKTIKEHGGARFRFCDTVGVLDPFKTYEMVKTIIDETGSDIEVHTHNDFGMATANALAAVKAGARYVNTTVIGLGERAGNAPLEEVIMASRHVYGMENPFNTTGLKELADYVSAASGRRIEPYRPIIGEFMFTHESGIHTDGVLKNPANYEPFDPAEVGSSRKLVLGRHSGTGVLKHKLMLMGVKPDELILRRLLGEVRSVSSKGKRLLNDAELMDMYNKLLRESEMAKGA